jgi:hypothetical protein
MASDRQPETQPPPATAEKLQWYGTPSALHYGALAASVLGPLAILIPTGRKNLSNQLQNMVLYSGSFWGVNQLAYDFTGKSIVQRSNDRWAKIMHGFDSTLPTEKARKTKELLREQKLRRLEDQGATQEAERLRREDEDARRRGLLTRVWMGDETDDWKRKRIEEDRKKIESGKGYGDIIMDQIWDVWNQVTGGEKKGEQQSPSPSPSPSPKTEGNVDSGEKGS